MRAQIATLTRRPGDPIRLIRELDLRPRELVEALVIRWDWPKPPSVSLEPQEKAA